jgi:hypothetical protein
MTTFYPCFTCIHTYIHTWHLPTQHLPFFVFSHLGEKSVGEMEAEEMHEEQLFISRKSIGRVYIYNVLCVKLKYNRCSPISVNITVLISLRRARFTLPEVKQSLSPISVKESFMTLNVALTCGLLVVTVTLTQSLPLPVIWVTTHKHYIALWLWKQIELPCYCFTLLLAIAYIWIMFHKKCKQHHLAIAKFKKHFKIPWKMKAI